MLLLLSFPSLAADTPKPSPKEAAAQEAQVAADLFSILVSEMAYNAAFDAFVATPVGPRALDALDATAVPFPTGEPWMSLGASLDHPTSATFQAEVSPDGKTVTVQAWQDLDGDKVPAHWIAGPVSMANVQTDGRFESEIYADLRGDGTLTRVKKPDAKTMVRKVSAAGVR